MNSRMRLTSLELVEVGSKSKIAHDLKGVHCEDLGHVDGLAHLLSDESLDAFGLRLDARFVGRQRYSATLAFSSDNERNW